MMMMIVTSLTVQDDIYVRVTYGSSYDDGVTRHTNFLTQHTTNDNNSYRSYYNSTKAPRKGKHDAQRRRSRQPV